MNRKERYSVNSDESSIVHVIYKTDNGSYEAVSVDSDHGAFVNSVFLDDPGVKFRSPPAPKARLSRYESHLRNRFESENVKIIYDDPGVKQQDPGSLSIWDKGAILQALFVRTLLMFHNVMTAWRVVVSYDNPLYWLLTIGNFFMLLEGQIIILKRGGVEYSWWCPCFAVYLATTLPGIWLLQLHQNVIYVQNQLAETNETMTTGVTVATTAALTMLTNATTDGVAMVTTAAGIFGNGSTLASNASFNATTMPMNVTTEIPLLQTILDLDSDTWIIIVQESLVYLIVLGRWALPRGEVGRDFLADLLLEFLAIASDIMELLALFDEDQVRANRNITYAILAIWSLSFIQFVPILMQKRRFRKIRHIKVEVIGRACGDKFVEVVVTCMSIFLQDGPFLVMRLYIMINLNIVTYSLVFFVLKNIVTLLLLFYRLAIVSYRLPCCYGVKGDVEGVQSVDLDHPVSLRDNEYDDKMI